MFKQGSMKAKLLSITAVSLIVGILAGYSLPRANQSSATDVHIREFAASYGSLRNLKEQGEKEAVSIMYTMMNNSLKQLFALYPNATTHNKEMIYISFKGYVDNIINNTKYPEADSEIDAMALSLIQKHNKSLNSDAPR